MLTHEEIEEGKRETQYSLRPPLHEHDDCVRIAYEWLDAQKKRQTINYNTLALKHIIERWGGRYVSQSDVEVAATLHPDVEGRYPYFNISAKLIDPNVDRLQGISEAYKHDYHRRHSETPYASVEGPTR